MTIKATSSASYLVSTLEDFIATADLFIQNHYKTGSDAPAHSKNDYSDYKSKA